MVGNYHRRYYRKYVYSGSTLVQMSVGENILSFGYDGSTPVTVTYNGTTYYYVTNLQGDIVAILDGNGSVDVEYVYNAWGDILSVTGSLAKPLGDINPLRYRGYVYDQETGLYYLQSRYYDPKIGRFINADVYASTGQGILGNNMHTYCLNNPSNMVDPTGQCCMFRSLRIYDCGSASCPDSSAYMDTSGNTPGTTMGYTINGQETLPYADEWIGIGSYGKSGCGLIAVYNAMQLIGQVVSLQDVANELIDDMLLYGAGGLNPLALDDYFTNHGIPFTSLYSKSALKRNVKEGSVFVFVVMNNKDNPFEGFHMMAGQYVNGQYRIYNRHNKATSYMTYASWSEGFGKELWIYGVLLG